ncbi:MAG TPA: hypothetical protein DD454_03970 [Candidatus Moranbacteria bacterium]|nr:hypothetical protein [Candidatus Moranbacteria bacterium]
MNKMEAGMGLPQTSKQEFVAETENSTDVDFEKKFNNKRVNDIKSELSSLAYDFEEGDINVDTVKYVVGWLSGELYKMDADPRADNHTRNAYKELDRIVTRIAPVESSEEIVLKLKLAIESLDQVR